MVASVAASLSCLAQLMRRCESGSRHRFCSLLCWKTTTSTTHHPRLQRREKAPNDGKLKVKQPGPARQSVAKGRTSSPMCLRQLPVRRIVSPPLGRVRVLERS